MAGRYQLTLLLIVLLSCGALMVAGVAYGQGSPTPQATNTTPSENELEGNPPSPPTENETTGYLSTKEFTTTLTVSGVALIAFIMEFMLLRRTENLRSEDILRVFAVTFIIFGTLFLVTVGFSSNQIAPAMGLFGTVAGYLLGRSTQRREQKDLE